MRNTVDLEIERPRSLLVIPDQSSRLRVQGDDRVAEEHIFAGVSRLYWRRIADAHIESLQLLVVGHAFPRSARATAVAPVIRFPRPRRPFHGRILEATGRVSRHRVEPPEMATRGGVERIDMAPFGAHFAIGIADEHHAAAYARRADDSVVLLWVTGRGFPSELSR